MRRTVTLTLLCVLVAPALQACNRDEESHVEVVFEDDEPEESAGAGEATLREKYEKRQEAKLNQPEPDVNPDDPREKFELVWRMGKGQLRSIYNERAEMIAMLKRMDLEEPEEQKLVDPWVEPLTQFGIGREPESMEEAPEELCQLIAEVRAPAEKLIAEGNEELKKLKDETEELEAKADAGGTVYQDQWDEIDEEVTRWSAPVKAGKQMLLVVRSLLEEAYVLADLGPRRVQRALGECLEPIAKEPLELNLAQEQLEKVVERTKWYRDLR
ncbi:MAG: hypothetical protein ACQEXJ_23840 [Myxococcota bacterium]